MVGCATASDSGSGTPEPPPVQNDPGPAAYRSGVNKSFEPLNENWSREFAERDVAYELPVALVSYWNRSQDKGCGGQRTGWSNARYCTPTDTISWDGNWVYGELYRQVGDASVAFLLGHEYGHLVQQRIGTINEFPLTIEGELNADCLAGGWLGAVDREVMALSDVDFDSLDTHRPANRRRWWWALDESLSPRHGLAAAPGPPSRRKGRRRSLPETARAGPITVGPGSRIQAGSNQQV